MKWPKCFRRKSKLEKKVEPSNSENEFEDEINAYDESQLDSLISKFSEEIFYDEEYKEKLLKMDINQKRILIKSRRQKFEVTFEALETMLENLTQLCLADSEDAVNVESEKLFDQLSAALRTESLRYVKHFVESNGLHLIFTYMRDKAVHALNGQTFSQCIRCIRSLGNSENGYNYLLAFSADDSEGGDDVGLLEVIGKGLWSRNAITVSMIAELFGALCFSEQGWLRVMNALKYLSRDDINYRFAILVQQFIFQDNFDVKCSILSLINALAEFVQDSQDPYINRVHLRFQALRHGLGHYFKSLTNTAHVALRKQIEVFVQHHQDDVEYLRTIDRLTIDDNLLLDSVHDTQMEWNDLIHMMMHMRKNLAFTDSQIHLSSLLHHLMLLPLQRYNGYLYLQLIDLLVQQISIEQPHAAHPDPGLVDIQINVDQLLLKLATDNELHAKQLEVDHLTKETEKLHETILSLENNILKIEIEKTKLENDYDSCSKELESEIKLREHVTSEYETLQTELAILRMKPCCHHDEKLTNGESVTVPQIALPPPPPPGPPPPPPPSAVPPPPPPPCGPPPPPRAAMSSLQPPMGSSIIPPPPIPGSLLANATKAILSDKKIPKLDTVPLKCLNWSKIPQSKLNDSVWNRINEDSLYSKIDLDLLQTVFSTQPLDPAFKSTVPLNSRASPQTSRRPSSVSIQASIINMQRSQNLALRLKQARISWSKWQKQLLDCNVFTLDDDDSFQFSLAEGLMKLYPTVEEIELLEDAVANHGIGNLPEAESFMYECSRFPYYQERLSCLIFFCKTPELIRRLSAELITLKTALNAITNNSTLPRLFEIVLAIGNIMNQKRGVAYGFKIDSLNQLKKLKGSSHNGSNGISNLLHFVVITVENTDATIFDLPKKLDCVQAACKINFNNIVKDLNEVGLSLKSLQSTVNIIKKNPIAADNFLDVADRLYPSICEDYEKLTELQTSIKSDIDKCHIFLGENIPSNSLSNSEAEDSTQKLFTELAMFLSDLDATWRSVLNDRERKLIMEERKNNRKNLVANSYNGGRKGDMDNNISRLLSGDAFSKNRLFGEMRDKQS